MTDVEEENECDFLIQDYTTVSPFERLVRLLERQLTAWRIKEVWSASTSPVKLNGLISAEFHKPVNLRLSATRLANRNPGPFYARAPQYQRWFQITEYVALELLAGQTPGRINIMHIEAMNNFLNALALALQSAGLPDLPAFVCREEDLKDHHIGTRRIFDCENGHFRLQEFSSAADSSGRSLALKFNKLLDTFQDDAGKFHRLASIDTHLAYMIVLYRSKLRFPKEKQLRCRLRNVYVKDSWPNLKSVMPLACHDPFALKLMCDTSRLNDLQAIRSMHFFMTYDFETEDDVLKCLHPLGCVPLTASSQPTLSVRPIITLDEVDSIMTTALERLSLAIESIGPLVPSSPQPSPKLIDNTPPNRFWPLTVAADAGIQLSPGETMLLEFALKESSMATWSLYVRRVRSQVETAWAVSDFESCLQPLKEEIGHLRNTLSSDPLVRRLDALAAIVIRRAAKGFLALAESRPLQTALCFSDILMVAMLPSPSSPEREVVILEELRRDHELQGLLVFARYRTYLSAAALFKKLQSMGLLRKDEDDDGLAFFWSMWLRVHKGGEIDDIILRGFTNEELIGVIATKDTKCTPQDLWAFRPVLNTDLDWIFPPDLLESECSLNLLEQVELQEVLETTNKMLEKYTRQSLKLLADHVGTTIELPEGRAGFLEAVRTAERELTLRQTLLYENPSSWTASSTFVKSVIAHEEADDFRIETEIDRRACLDILRHSKQDRDDVVSLTQPFLKEFVIEPESPSLDPFVRLYAFWHDEELRVAWNSSFELATTH